MLVGEETLCARHWEAAEMAKRISKELEKLRSDPELVEPNFSIDVQSTDCWILSFICPADMIYEGEKYALRITFGPNYPIESPEVNLTPIPYFCLDILIFTLIDPLSWAPTCPSSHIFQWPYLPQYSLR